MFLKNFHRSIIILILFVSLFYTFNFVADEKKALANVNSNKLNAEVFKTPSCGCCYGYVLFLEREKYNVKQTDMRSLHSIKQKYNLPVEMQSCHTTIIGKYFIEGHVPLAAINKLFKEKPEFRSFKPFIETENRIGFGYIGDHREIQISLLKEKYNNSDYVLTKSRESYTLFYWHKNVGFDSLNFLVKSKNFFILRKKVN